MANKKISVIAASITIAIIFGSCWSYQSLNEMSLVAGVAFDVKEGSENYKLTYEILDLTKPIREVGISSKLVISEGKTFSDATRNAKNKLRSELYFGHMQTAIISEEIAKNDQLLHVVDWLLRDMEFRETLNIVVSKAPYASDILNTQGLDQPIISFKIGNIVKQNKKVTSSTSDDQLHDIFTKINSGRTVPTLPAARISENDGSKMCEIYGTAVFKDKNLVGYLNPEESKYFLFATDKIEGGALTISSNGKGKDDMTLRIVKNKTKRSYSYENKKLKAKLKIKTIVFLEEASLPLNSLDKKQMAELEQIAEKKLAQSIETVVKKVQNEFNSDIFGFSDMIYKKDPKLWKKLSGQWDETFTKLSVDIEANIDIASTETVKK